MTLRRKTALSVLAACIVAVVVLYFTVQSILASYSSTVERQKADQDLERASNALNLDVASIETAVGVWAPWDDTYQFIQDNNTEYIASNLNSSTLMNLGFDFIVYVNTAGQIRYWKAIEASNGTEVSLLYELKPFVTGEGLLAQHPSETSSVAGVLFLPEHLALVASQPILTSQKEGPIAGSLIMGRYLDSEEVQRLSDEIDLSLALYRVDDADMPEDFQVARASLSDLQTSLVRVLDGNTIAGYTLVNEINGNPALVLGIEGPREVHAQAQQTAYHVLYLVLGLGALFTVLVLIEIDVVVMRRLRRLSAGVAALDQGGNLSERVSVGGRDEVAAMAEAVNRNQAVLEQSQRDLVQSEARNRSLLGAIPDLVFLIDKEGRIRETRGPQRAIRVSDILEGQHSQRMLDKTADLIPAQIQQMAVPHVTKAIASRQMQIFQFQLTVDGREFHYEARVVANSDTDALIIVRDITAQKLEEEARQNSLVLKEIHSRVKNHLQLIRSFPEAGHYQVGGTSPGTHEQIRGRQQNDNTADAKRSPSKEKSVSEPVGSTTQEK